MSFEEKDKSGIGTLSEKSIHSTIKDFFEKDKEYQEIKVGRYVADIKRDNNIIEIQTKDFKKLIPKIEYYLKTGYNIKIVYPIILERYTNWVSPINGKVLERRKSPIKGCIQDSLLEIYWIQQYLDNNNFNLSLITLNIEEYKLLDGCGQNNKKKATKIDKIPTSIIEEITISTRTELYKLIPNTLKDEFTAKEFVKESKSRKKWSGSYVKLLREIGVIEIIRKEGNTYIYRRKQNGV